MKNILLTALVLTATTLATANEPDQSPESSSYFDLLEHLFAPAQLARGMTPREIHDRLGKPSATLDVNVWVYWDFKAKDTPGAEQADTLLVIFADNRVQRFRLVDGKPVRTFIAQQQAKGTKDAVASK